MVVSPIATSSLFGDSLRAKDLPISFFETQGQSFFLPWKMFNINTREIDEQLLDCILESLSVFQQSLKPLPMDASMIYSAALLNTCIRTGKMLIGPAFESSTAHEVINVLTRCREELRITPTTNASTSFQLIADRAVAYIKQCSGPLTQHSDRMFWLQEHHCIWMLIYWLCDTFEAFSEFFKALGVYSSNFHPVSNNCLLESSLLRGDTEFPPKFISFMKLRPDWTVTNIDIMSIAIREDDAALLQTVMNKTEEKKLIEDWHKAWQVAYTHLKWDVMNLLLPLPGFNLDALCQALLWLSDHHHEWRGIQTTLDSIQSRDTISKSDSTSNLHGSYGSIIENCAEIIHEGDAHDLEIFLDVVQQRLGISFAALYSDTDQLATQLTVLPALLSRKLSMVKLLSERHVVSMSKNAVDTSAIFIMFKRPEKTLAYNRLCFSIYYTPLYLAIAFVLDLEVVEYLCHAGARLWERSSRPSSEHSEVLENLRLTTSVADAQTQSCHMKVKCYKLCFAEKGLTWSHKMKESTGGRDGATESLAKTWITMWRILYENDCRDLYDVTKVSLKMDAESFRPDRISPRLTWPTIQKQLYPDQPPDAAIKMATSWPAPLSTQEAWDDWRLKVIDVIERTHEGHFKTSE